MIIIHDLNFTTKQLDYRVQWYGFIGEAGQWSQGEPYLPYAMDDWEAERTLKIAIAEFTFEMIFLDALGTINITNDVSVH